MLKTLHMTFSDPFVPSFNWPVRIYFQDTDLSGVVYHSRYLDFMERGRSEVLREHGIDQTQLTTEDRFLALRSVDVTFLAPARIDDLVAVQTHPVSSTGARAILDQRIVRNETVLCTARVVVLCITGAGRPARLPASIQTLFP
ncbi:MAG: YbgC/FadM family acyl-CoA thioesterase [Pseudomonadota bacterium]